MYILMFCVYCLIDFNIGYFINILVRIEEKIRFKKFDKKIIIFKYVLYKNVEYGVVFNKIMYFIIVIFLRL